MSKAQQANENFLRQILGNGVGPTSLGNLPAAFQVYAAKAKGKRVAKPKAPKHKRGK